MKPTTSTTTAQSSKKSQSPFQELINSSIHKIKQSYPQSQLQQFNQLLNNQQPKKVKELNIDPYLFILQFLFSKQDLIPFALKQIHVYLIIIQENYASKTALSEIIRFLSDSVDKYSAEVVNILLKIKDPSKEIFDLFFQIYSTVLLPEEIARKFRNLGYLWLIKIFRMKQTTIPFYFKFIIDKIGLFEVPQLISEEEEKKQLQTYVHKILNNLLNKVEDKIDLDEGQKSLVVRKQKKGKYLYCFMCQKPADYYCKDTKVPVCSPQCKKDHLLYISEVNIVNEQFPEQFKRQIQQMLLSNWYQARSPSLSVDYLIAIYIFSSYQTHYQIEHSKIIRSPIMVEKVWLLYSAYYEKKGQMFEHIFISFFFSQNEYLQQLTKFYFLQISQTHRILDVYYNFDLKGDIRLFPAIFKKMHEDKEYLSIFVTNFVEIIFQSLSAMSMRPISQKIILPIQLVELFNESPSPIQALGKYFPEYPTISTSKQVAYFLLKNECLIKKQRFTQILDKEEQFIKVFLEAITLKRKNSRIDELLRQIFYFVNVNVSQKIYRLLELLYEVYDFERLGNEHQKNAIEKNDALFQYMYLVIMLNTQLHNPNLQKKPTLTEVIQRVAVINKHLAYSQQHRQIIESMFQRLKTIPFSQQTRGILKNYEICPLNPFNFSQFYLPLMILQNSESIYDTFKTVSVQNSTLYRVCTILTFYPDICGIFFKLLLERLSKLQQEDQYLLQAIRNILQEQPNAVNIEGGWKIIFDYIKEADIKRKKLQRLTVSQGQLAKKPDESISTPLFLSQTSLEGDKKRRKIFQPYNVNTRSSLGQIQRSIVWLDLQSVIVSTPLLNHDNLIYFIKDFGNTFSIDSYSKEYEKIIYLNKSRLNSMANGLMNAFRKVQNKWIGLNLIEFIGNLEEVQLQVESNQNSEGFQSIKTGNKDGQLRVNNPKDGIIRMQKIKNHLIMLMLKQIPVTDITQLLILGTINSLCNSKNFKINEQLWECITHIVLKFKSQENQSIVEELMKQNEAQEEYYESLIIQKTLKSQQPDMISKDVLVKLDKLEPYLGDMKDTVLKLFIIKANLNVIQRNIDKFYIFNQTFELFSQCVDSISNINTVDSFLVNKIQYAIQHQLHLQSFLSKQFLLFLLNSFESRIDSQQLKNLFIQYFYYLSLCISTNSFQEKSTLDKSVIFYQACRQVTLLLKGVEEKINLKNVNKVRWLIEPVELLSQFCVKFNQNLEYRKIISQTYTFKEIVHFYQSQNHSVYIIGVTKQLICCKRLIWTIRVICQDDNDCVSFLSKQITQLSSCYSQISSETNDFNKALVQILDHKTVDDIFFKLKQKVIEFREKFKFTLILLHELYFKKQNLQYRMLSGLHHILRQFSLKILFEGVFNVEIRQHSAKTDKKSHLPHQRIRTQPFSQFLDNLGQQSEQIKQIIQKLINSTFPS